MSIWKRQATVEALNATNPGTLNEALGIRFTEIGADYLRGTLPVDPRTRQPYGLLHGGASVALAESLGSVAGWLSLPEGGGRTMGLEINATHVRATTDGVVTGTARPLHLGRSTQVWEVRIEDAQGRLTCVSRITLVVVAG